MTDRPEASASGSLPEPSRTPAGDEAGDETRDEATVAVPEPRRVELRRAPRYRAFVVTGVLVGVLIALVTGAFSAGDPRFSGSTTLGYSVMVLALIGGVLGAAAAVLVERPHR